MNFPVVETGTRIFRGRGDHVEINRLDIHDWKNGRAAEPENPGTRAGVDETSAVQLAVENVIATVVTGGEGKKQSNQAVQFELLCHDSPPSGTERSFGRRNPLQRRQN